MQDKIKLGNSQIFEKTLAFSFSFFLVIYFICCCWVVVAVAVVVGLFDGHLSESDATIINSDQKYIYVHGSHGNPVQYKVIKGIS